jgi:hypothetical protein
LLLGTEDNKIEHTSGNPTNIYSTGGVTYLRGNEPSSLICKLGSTIDTKSEFYNNISMNSNRITGLSEPLNSDDACSKQYVDRKVITSHADFAIRHYVKNSVGLIPQLASSTADVSGFFVTTSSFIPGTYPSWLFNANFPGWDPVTPETPPGLQPQENVAWIQIQCPDPVIIYKFHIKAKPNPVKLQHSLTLTASNDGEVFYTLFSIRDTPLNFDLVSFDIPINVSPYKYFRLQVSSLQERNFGLRHWQLFTLDPTI